MTTYDYDMIVLGGGAAGLTVTAGAAQLGVKVLLVEKEPLLGGDCLHYGCVPSKTLIKSARVYHQMTHAAQWGLPQPDCRGNNLAVDFSTVAQRIQSVKDAIQPHDSPERFEKLGAEVIFGVASFLDAHTIRILGSAGHTVASAKQIIIATGSSPSTPSIPGLAQTNYLTNHEIFSLSTLPASLIVLGGGPIAMEMAQAFQRLGSKVTIIQRSDQVLSKEDKDMADVVQETMEREGVQFFLNAAVREVRTINAGADAGVTPGVEVEVEQRDGTTCTLQSTHLFVAMGRSPNMQSLQLDMAGVVHSPKGIPVDAKMRTNQKHIYACGDVTGQHQFTHAAGYEGGIVVSNAVFKLPRKTDYTWLPRVTYTDPELASIGLNEKQAQERAIEYTVRTEPFSANDRALAEGSAEGKIKMLLNNKEKIIGVQIVGPHAGELMNEWVAILGGGVKLTTIAGAIHPYPTLGEINKRVAGSLIGEKLFSGKVRSGLCFLFGYQGKCSDTPDD